MKFYSNDRYTGSPVLGRSPVAAYGWLGDIRTASLERDLRQQEFTPTTTEKKSSAGLWVVAIGGGIVAGAIGGYLYASSR